MEFDLTPFLTNWEYQPGKIVVRKFTSKEGVEKIQLRVDLGILQMNVDGRPDGTKPYGCESLLEHYLEKLEAYQETHEGDDEGYWLTPEDCALLQQEAIQYHHRYICHFQLKEYDKVIRDTERNLEVLDFSEAYAESDDLAWSLQQFRPQLILMQVRAKASIALEKDDYKLAMSIVSDGIKGIREFYRDQERNDLMESSPELSSLEVWIEEIGSQRPLTTEEKLEKEMEEAVRRENYERAAEIRDQIKKLKH